MTRIVTTAYRPKRPPKRKAVAFAGPAIVRKRVRADAAVPPDRVDDPPPANDARKPDLPETGRPSIVTARRPGAQRVDVPDLTPEEYQRRGDAADALWRDLVRRVTAKDQP